MSLEDRQADVYGDLQVLVCHFNRKFPRRRINMLFRRFERCYEMDGCDWVYDVADEMDEEIVAICKHVGITREQLADFANLEAHEDIELKFDK